MKLTIGIVGLPNVGKSTLFNTLTSNEQPAENYPFCTIDPNVGIVEVHDPRLAEINKIQDTEKVIPAVIEFVDIAGIIKGAHEGEGLGNKFLSHIREVDAIVQVVRMFEDGDVMHVNNKIDPADDINTINMELILKDIETVEDRLNKLTREFRSQLKKQYILDWLKGLLDHLGENKLANTYSSKDDETSSILREMFLLTNKNFIYLVNTDNTNQEISEVKSKIGLESDANVMLMDVKTEYEIFMLGEDERDEYLEEMGIEVTGLQKLTQIAYESLGLISFFTSGKKEVKAWTVNKNEHIRDAAAVIHNDFRDKFIAADVIYWENFIEASGWEAARDKGLVKLEGKDYIVKDGDIIIFKHGA